MTKQQALYNDVKSGKVKMEQLNDAGKKAFYDYSNQMKSALYNDYKAGKVKLEQLNNAGRLAINDMEVLNRNIQNKQQSQLESKVEQPTFKNKLVSTLKKTKAIVAPAVEETARGITSGIATGLDIAQTASPLYQGKRLLQGKGLGLSTETSTAIRPGLELSKERQQKAEQQYKDYGFNEGVLQASKIGANVGTFLLNPALGVTSTIGTYKEQGLDKGLTEEQAIGYGLGFGAIDAATQAVSLGTSKFVSPFINKALGKTAESLTGKALQTAGRIGSAGVAEGTQETGSQYMQDIADNYIFEKKRTLGELLKPDTEKLLTTFFIAGVTGGLIDGARQGVESAKSVIDKQQKGEEVTPIEFEKAIKDTENVTGNKFTPQTIDSYQQDLFGGEKKLEAPIDNKVNVEEKISNTEPIKNQIKFALYKNEPKDIKSNTLVKMKSEDEILLDELNNNIDKIKEKKGFSSDTVHDIVKKYGNDTKEVFDKMILNPLRDSHAENLSYKNKWYKEINEKVSPIFEKYNKNKDFKKDFTLFAENKISKEDMETKYGKDFNEISNAVSTFKRMYNQIFDDWNASRRANGQEEVKYREDYMTHQSEFEFTDFINSMFEGNTTSGNKLKETTVGYAKERKGGKTFYDPIGNFSRYIESVAHDISYEKVARNSEAVAKKLKSNEDTKNLGKWFDEYAQNLRNGKYDIDRFIEGRSTPEVKKFINTAYKLRKILSTNQIVANGNSMLMQITSIPNAMMIFNENGDFKTNSIILQKVLQEDAIKTFNKNYKSDADKAMEKSLYLKERWYGSDIVSKYQKGRNLYEKIYKDTPSAIIKYTLENVDKAVQIPMWKSFWIQGNTLGVKDPIRYADEMSSRAFASRNVGEIPNAQRSEIVKILTPYAIEQNNAYNEIKKAFKGKNIKGIFILFLSTWLINNYFEMLSGYRPLGADLIDLGVDVGKIVADTEKSIGSKVAETTQRTAGEGIKTVAPMLSAGVALLPKDIQETLFSKEFAPSKFGNDLSILKPVGDVTKDFVEGKIGEGILTFLTSYGLPFGGSQARKTIQGITSYDNVENGLYVKNKGETSPMTDEEKVKIDALSPEDVIKYAQNNGIDIMDVKSIDELREKIKNIQKSKEEITHRVDDTIGSRIKAGIFGKSSVKGLSGYIEKPEKLGTEQTLTFKKLVKDGIDSNKLYDFVTKNRKTNKQDIIKKVIASDFSDKEKASIIKDYYGYSLNLQ